MQHSYDITVIFKVDLEGEDLEQMRTVAAGLNQLVQSGQTASVDRALKDAILWQCLAVSDSIVSVETIQIESEETYVGK